MYVCLSVPFKLHGRYLIKRFKILVSFNNVKIVGLYQETVNDNSFLEYSLF